MPAHPNARSCPNCRAVMVIGRPVREVAALFGISRQTVYKWIRRHRDGGPPHSRIVPADPTE